MRAIARATVVAGICLLLGPAVRAASAVTLDDLVNLKRNGLSDENLVALIQTDGSVFHLSARDIASVRKLGLSDSVILAMVMTNRAATTAVVTDAVASGGSTSFEASSVSSTLQPASPAPVIQVQQTVIQHVDRGPIVTYVPVAVPVVVPVILPTRPEPPPAPVYWGFGGNRRPDSWIPAAETKFSDPSAVKPADPSAKKP